MTVTPTGTSADPALEAATRREIARVRASGALGESGRLRELFDFLADRPADLPPPKEVEIAVAVFGKAEAETLKDDPVARVYVHRLRKRLDEFYRENGAPEGVRLDVPKGQYRVAGRRVSDARTEARRHVPAPLAAAAAFALALVLVNAAVWAIAFRPHIRDAHAAEHAVWSGMEDTGRPLLIVVGDYYLFGDYGDSPFLRRLVRDFSINSREDLLTRRMEDPATYGRYADVDLQYLPVSAAYALSAILPDTPHGKPMRVTLASDLTPDMIRSNDLVYVGLLSGLGMLRDPVFARSRFTVGASYDELIDTATGEFHVSGFTPDSEGGMYRDYGFFSRFAGPDGNRIVVIAGTRDAAVTGVAERIARNGTLASLREAAGSGDLEAVWEVDGQQNVSMDARVLTAAPLDSRLIWTAQTEPRAFPAE